MERSDEKDKFGQIRKGLLEFAVLKIVSRGQVYAADMLRELSGTDFATQEGTLYPLLSRLRRDGMVDYEWKESASGPPRKYYRLADKGEKELKELERYWKKIGDTINSLGK
ncbi:MAG TPA: PadR family transcriptional regulator [Candidatus Paceibacterota bacterium]|jgi:Predicted transcriptional regulators